MKGFTVPAASDWNPETLPGASQLLGQPAGGVLTVLPSTVMISGAEPAFPGQARDAPMHPAASSSAAAAAISGRRAGVVAVLVAGTNSRTRQNGDRCGSDSAGTGGWMLRRGPDCRICPRSVPGPRLRVI